MLELLHAMGAVCAVVLAVIVVVHLGDDDRWGRT